ncbi:MAG: hypothetical protein AAFV53_22990 [Myxococcota bacterium]
MMTAPRALLIGAGLLWGATGCNPAFLPAPANAQLVVPDALTLPWNLPAGRDADPPVTLLASFSVQDVNNFPLQSIAVQVGSSWEGVYMLPVDSLEPIEVDSEGFVAYVPEEALVVSSDGEDIKPLNVQLETDRQGVAQVLVVVESAPGDLDEYVDALITASIGVAFGSFTITFESPGA